MPDLADGATAEVQGSGAKPYVLKNTGGVYSCSCPAWRNQSTAIERRTCKHLRAYRGDAAEVARLGAALPPPVVPAGSTGSVPPLLLAESWTPATDPAGWWVSEKLDGVRAYWSGAAFVSRLGNPFYAPPWFTAGLPATPLDGELWVGRKQFPAAVGVVRRQDQPDTWRTVRFVVFDAPAAPGPFEARLAHATAAVTGAAFAELLPHAICTGADHLNSELARVEALGGEGLMLRQAGSAYVAGRSGTLLKVKRFQDCEATVTGYEPGKGRHKGRAGALLVTLADGTAFRVGSGLTDADRLTPPAVGTTVMVRYQELTPAGVPRFPTYAGVRPAGV